MKKLALAATLWVTVAMPAVAEPTVKQYRMFFNEQDYSLCFTGAFDNNGSARYQLISAFPVYKLFSCGDTSGTGAVIYCREFPYGQGIGYCARRACEAQKEHFPGLAHTLHCAGQDVGGNWLVE